MLTAKILSQQSLKQAVGLQQTCKALAHTDIKFPDYDEYRRPSSLNPSKKSIETESQRQVFSYLSTFAVGAAGAISAKALVQHALFPLAPSKDVLAIAKLEVKLNEIPPGKVVTVKWRGKPVFIRHRTQAEIDDANRVDLSDLRDPEVDADRAKKPEWLIVIGICTHLGCVPIANKGLYNGYYCPCHGSHYDSSGRARQGPAPKNLEVPEYEFIDDSTVVLG